MRKRFLSTLLALCMALTLLPGTAGAAETSEKEYPIGQIQVKDGYDTVYLYYVENEAGGITITEVSHGSGAAVAAGVVPGSLDLIIPDTINGKPVTAIGDAAFKDAFWALNVLKLPDTIKSIGMMAFDRCYISGIKLSRDLTSIAPDAFGGNQLSEFEIPAENKNFSTVDGVLYDGGKSKLICYPAKKADSTYTISSGVATIGAFAFDYSENLSELNIPASVTAIGEYSEYYGYHVPALGYNEKLTAIDVAAGNPNFSSVDGVLFNGDKTKLIYYPQAKETADYKIPDGVTSIEGDAFKYCEGLSSISIPASVTEIGDRAINAYDERLTDIYYAGSESQWEQITMDDTDRDALSKQTTIHFGSESPVTPPSTGGYPIGGPAVSRTVTISSVTGGTVTTPTRFPYPNAWVTLTVTADEGYELTDLTVTNRYGQTVPVHQLEDGRYGFTMPDSDVTVNPVFTKTVSSPQPGAGFGSGGYADIIYPGPAMAFTDVRPGDWFHDSVNYVYTRRLMNGVSATAFAPQGTTSRAMIWTVLARLSGLDTTGGESWYERGRIWAMNRGITDGTVPQGDITREQLVTMLWRFKGSAQLPGDALAQFSDRSDLSPYAVTAANWAVNAGLLKGDNGRLNPQGTATRAEAAAILQRLCQTAA